MKNLCLRPLLTLFFVFAFFPAHGSKIDCVDNVRSGIILLTGSIEVGDYKKVKSCWESLTQPTDEQIKRLAELNQDEPGRYVFVQKSMIFFFLSSEGGSVSEAMKIGRLVRENEFWVLIPAEGGRCFSSCLYILAGGVVRLPWGAVGIHRPYFLSAPSQTYDVAVKEILDASKAYFREMNIPEFLADDMFSVPPDELKILGDDMLTKYRLNQADIAYQEKNDMRMAELYGLSRQEYMKRKGLKRKYEDECRKGFVNGDPIEITVTCDSVARQKAGLEFAR